MTAETLEPRPIPALRRDDRGLPYIGQVLEYAKDPVGLYRRHWERYGPVAPFRTVGGNAAMLLGPDACGEALQNKDKAFANGPAWSQLVGPFFHRGLMLIDFDEHLIHRRIMQEAFTRPRLEGYTARLHPAIERGMASWTAGTEFPAYWRLKQLTLDIAADLFMGGAGDTSQAEMDRVNKAFIACVQAAAGIVRAHVPFTRWGRAYRGRKVLDGTAGLWCCNAGHARKRIVEAVQKQIATLDFAPTFQKPLRAPHSKSDFRSIWSVWMSSLSSSVR